MKDTTLSGYTIPKGTQVSFEYMSNTFHVAQVY